MGYRGDCDCSSGPEPAPGNVVVGFDTLLPGWVNISVVAFLCLVGLIGFVVMFWFMLPLR